MPLFPPSTPYPPEIQAVLNAANILLGFLVTFGFLRFGLALVMSLLAGEKRKNDEKPKNDDSPTPAEHFILGDDGELEEVIDDN